MGYYCSITDDSYVEGYFNTAEIEMSWKDPSYSLSNLVMRSGELQTPAPFQLVRMDFDPSSEIQLKTTIISPRSYDYIEFERSSFHIHQHNTFELMYVLEGTLYQRIESERHVYPAGSFVLLNRYVRHCEEADTAFTTISLSLSAEYFNSLLKEDRDQVFKTGRLWGDNTDLKGFLSSELQDSGKVGKNYIDFIPLHTEQSCEDPISELFEKMIKIMLNPKPGDVFTFKAHICQLLNLLCQRELFTTHPINLGTQSESRIFSKILLLMEESNGRISRESLVEKLHYSGSYLNRIVQTFTGMNISQYALHNVLNRATWLLVNTDKTISDIVAELGMSNRSYFYTEFHKHYGLTPREYRLLYRKL